MNELTLIIHGWSDSSQSFEPIKKTLVKQKIGQVADIYFGDYESREDHMTFDDVVDGLNDEMINWGFIDALGRKKVHLNVIVHSTGGLVIRHWLWRYYFKNGDQLDRCPVKRLIMLAPANFGSPLAHRGKSFIGGLLKGRWKIGDLFEVGQKFLHGLELGSPYQWQLAHQDLLLKKPYFNSEQIQTTILVGIKDYEGLAGMVNKPGTDGTVVIAGTSLDTAKLRLDFTKPKHNLAAYRPYEWSVTNPPEDFAFAVLPEVNHATIVEEAANSKSLTNQLLVQALTCRSNQAFLHYQDRLDKLTATTYQQTAQPQYQQFIFHAIDDQEQPVMDYTLAFYVYQASKGSQQLVLKEQLNKKEEHYSQLVQQAFNSGFHTHSQDSSYRRILIDGQQIVSLLNEARQAMKQDVVLSMKMYIPKIDRGIRYRHQDTQNIILVDQSQVKQSSLNFLYPNTTTLVELKVDRYNDYVSITKQARKH